VPDANRLTAHGVLAAERAGEAGVLRDFHLLDLLAQRGTVTGTVLADDASLLSALALRRKRGRRKKGRRTAGRDK
jgi:hypothetical protein